MSIIKWKEDKTMQNVLLSDALKEESRGRLFPDLSSYQGRVNFQKLSKDFKHAIIRTTTKEGTVDRQLANNINGCLSFGMTMDFYKFMYAKTYDKAYKEMLKAIKAVQIVNPGLLIHSIFFADIEKINGKTHTKDEACDVLFGAHDACRDMGVQFGIYCNYDYLMISRLIPLDFCKFNYPIWLARYNTQTGTTGTWNVIYWQFTSHYQHEAVFGDMDCNYAVKYSEITNRGTK